MNEGEEISMEESLNIKPDSFADGIRKLNTRGSFILPAKLTKKRAVILLDFIAEFKHNWYCTHNNNDKEGEHNMQMAMQWILNQVSKRWSQNELHTPRKRKKIKP